MAGSSVMTWFDGEVGEHLAIEGGTRPASYGEPSSVGVDAAAFKSVDTAEEARHHAFHGRPDDVGDGRCCLAGH